MTFDDYINIDSEVQTDAEVTEEEILAEITPAAMTEVEEEDENEEDTDKVCGICSLADAKGHPQEVRLFLQTLPIHN